MPELQGEPEDISKEKARIAAKEVLYPGIIAYMCVLLVYAIVKAENW